MINFLTTNDTIADFDLPQETADFLIDIGFGKDVSSKDRDYWRSEIKHHYSGDDGRQRAHGCHQLAGQRRLARALV
jgi:hypothetical protein